MSFDTTREELAELHNMGREPVERISALQTMGGVTGLVTKLNSSLENGVFPGSLAKRREAFGVNEYAQPEPLSFLELCLDALNDSTMIILCISAAVSLGIGLVKGGEWYEGLAILVAVVIVTLVTAINEYKKEQQFQDLNKVKEKVSNRVIRGGTEQPDLPATEIVVGDIVRLSQGDKIPADGIVFQCYGSLQVDESTLFGEPEPVKKNDTTAPMLYSGCNVAIGEAAMVVTSVGDYSQQGIIRLTLTERDEVKTPLQKKLDVQVDKIGFVGLAVAASSFFVLTISWINDGNYQWGELQEGSWKGLLDFLIIAVTIVAVAVPEGLPLAVTISLAYSMNKMMDDMNLVRKLQACETMGSATAICSDKTGTLTQNRMTVVEGEISGSSFTVVDGQPTLGNPMRSDALQRLHRAAALNSSASCELKENGIWSFHGSKTECAVLMFSRALGGDYNRLRAEMGGSVFSKEPFNSEAKYASVAFKYKNICEMYTTGAPEKVLARCAAVDTGHAQPTIIDPLAREQLMQKITSLAQQGLRTVAIGYKVLSHEKEAEDPDNLVLLGVVGIKDPLRPDVPEAVRQCQQAGIVVRMVTGDNVHTAVHIAKECGIMQGNGVALEGPQFGQMTDQEIISMLPRLLVLARSSPTDKLRLVELLQQQNEVVAVTGDGTNDAPALHQANVGLSMGKTGTQVAMDASDIVIIDDNFASIVKSVKWGRSVFDNICKFIQFQLTINVVALTVSFAAAVYCAFVPPKDTMSTSFDTEKCTPLNAIQLLWINLIMDSMGALALATEEPDKSLLQRKPVPKDADIVNPMMLRNILVQAAYQLLMLTVVMVDPAVVGFNTQFQSRHHYTVVFNVFVWFQIFNEFNSRRLDNTPDCFEGVLSSKIFVGVIIATVVVQYLFVEFGGDYTKTVPLSSSEWLLCVAWGAVSIPIGYVIRSFQLFVKDHTHASLTRDKRD